MDRGRTSARRRSPRPHPRALSNRRKWRSDLSVLDEARGSTPALRLERAHPRPLARRPAPAKPGLIRAAVSFRRPQRLGPLQPDCLATGGFDALVAAHVAAAFDG